MRLLLLIATALTLSSCTNPNKAQDIDTEMERRERVNGGEDVGLKNGEMILQRKVDMAEELRRIQVDVFELEDRVYGNQKYGSSGMYGTLKNCRKKRSNKANGGNGKLIWTEKPDRPTNVEDKLKIGLDEKNQLVAIKEEYLLDRIKRFRKYKRVLTARETDFKDKLDICDTGLQSQIYDMKAKSKTN